MHAVVGRHEKEVFVPQLSDVDESYNGVLEAWNPADAMYTYEDIKKSPDPPEELPYFRIILKGLLPHPLFRNRVKQDFEELFREQHV